MRNGKIRIGIMGLGQIGRHLYHLALEIDDIEIVAVADIGKPEIIQYLLNSDGVDEAPCELQDNYLINEKFRTRMLQLARPEEVPWDVLNVHCVVDATGRYRSRRDMEAHLRAGAPRVILASLPAESIDRIVIPGINEGERRRRGQNDFGRFRDDQCICAFIAISGSGLRSRLRVDDDGPRL